MISDNDSTPVPGRVRRYFAGQHFDVLVIAELMDDGWRGRYAYNLLIGKRAHNGSKVIDQRYATGEDAFMETFHSVMKHLSDNYSWSVPAMMTIRGEFDITIASFMRWNNIPKSTFKIWQ
jgi:hypothetical protein